MNTNHRRANHMEMMQAETHIAFHDASCCRVAQEWLFSMDDVYSRLENSQLRLSWLYERYAWGPHFYPFAWCDLRRVDALDCGVFADLVQTLLQRRGIECSRIQQYGLAHESQKVFWKGKWASAGLDFSHWIVDDTFIYHELLVLNQNGTSRFFDTTDHRFVDEDDPYLSRVMYMKQCQPMSIPVVYHDILLKPLAWTPVCGEDPCSSR